MYSVLPFTCHQLPNTEPVTISLNPVMHATFKSNIPLIQDTIPQLSNKMLYNSVKSLKAFPTLLSFIHIAFYDDKFDYQIKLAESELSLVNPCSPIPVIFLAFKCSEADSERSYSMIFPETKY